MRKEINNRVVLADFSKDYNAFRWIYSILFFIVGLICLQVSLMYVLKMIGLQNRDLQWFPIFDPESFPYEGNVTDFLGTGVTILMATFFFYFSGSFFLKGKVIKVVFDPEENEIIAIRNGVIEKNIHLKIDNIKYLRKKRNKPSRGFISTGQHHIQTMSFQNTKGYAVLKGSNEFVFLFEFYDKKKFDQSFRKINKFIKEKKAG